MALPLPRTSAADPRAGGGQPWPGGPVTTPFRFRLDGREYDVPEIPAGRLLHILATGSWGALFPEALPPDQYREIHARLFDRWDDFEYRHLWWVSTTLLARLAGTTNPPPNVAGMGGYYPAHRLAASLITHWMPFTGWARAHGFDPLGSPLHELIATGYYVLRSGCKDEQEARALDMRVWAPPPVALSAAVRHSAREEAASARAALESMGLDLDAMRAAQRAARQAKPGASAVSDGPPGGMPT